MIVYPDTSFILSLWHTGDSNYAEALKLFSKLSGIAGFGATFINWRFQSRPRLQRIGSRWHCKSTSPGPSSFGRNGR